MATTLNKKKKVRQRLVGIVFFRRLGRGGCSWSCVSWMFVLVPQFVADGVFYAELNELLTRELAEDGYSGVEVRNTPMRVEIIIRATRTQSVLGA